MGTVALSNRTQLFVSSHLLLAANACSASLSPQSLAQGPKPTVSVLAHCCSTLWVQLHATQLHPSPRLSSLSHWVQSLAEQPHPPPRLSSLSHWAQLYAEQPHPPPHLISSLSPHASVRCSFSGASPCASVLPVLYVYLISCQNCALLRRLRAGVCRACCLLRARETTVKSMHDHPSERRAASAPTKSRYAQNCSLFPKGNRSPASPAHLKKTTHTCFSVTLNGRAGPFKFMI